MTADRLTFTFEADLWEYDGEAPWVFVTLPLEDAEAIRMLAPASSGFGSVRVRAVLGNTEWGTSLFPDKDSGSFLLPVKRPVRQAEDVEPGDVGCFAVTIVA